MKKQDGKTALELILAIAISVIVAGVAFAMIFGGTDITSKITNTMQKNNTNVTDNVQEEEKIS